MCPALDEAEKRGISIGEKRGISIGEKKAAVLINYLWKNGRGEDAERAENDRDFFNKLSEELLPILEPAK